MIIWSILIAGYILVAARLIWAIHITRKTTVISKSVLAERIANASKLMLDQQIVAVQADRPEVGFQIRKTINPDNEFVLEAIIPFSGCAELLELLVLPHIKDYTIQHCESLETVDGILTFRVETKERFASFLNIFQVLFAVPDTSNYAISKAYLLDARQPLRAKISRFANRGFSSDPEDICEMLCPSNADLFQSEDSPRLHANEYYLLAVEKNGGISHD